MFLALTEIFPDAPIYTSFFDQENFLLYEKFKDKNIQTSFLQKIPGCRDFYKALLPLYPIAFEQFDFSSFDLVISHTTRFAKSIITKPKTIHVCYTHTPPRFLWNFSQEKNNKLLSPYLSFLRIYDQVVAERVDYWMSGSKNCQNRIRKIYKKESRLLYPFIDLKEFKDIDEFDGGYYLMITRLTDYKKVDLAVEVFNENKRKLKIIGVGQKFNSLKKQAKKNIEFLGSVSDEIRVNLLSGCKGLIVTGEEDFGLTSLEAQACGKGVIAYGVGGSLETVIESKTGLFFKEQTAECLAEVVEKFEVAKFSTADCKENAKRFSREKFQRNLLKIIDELLE